MSRNTIFWHKKKRKSNDHIIWDLRRKKHSKKRRLSRVEKILDRYLTMESMISHALVDNSKQQRSDEQTIEDIRKYLCEYGRW